MDPKLAALRKVRLEVDGKLWNFRTDYDDAVLQQAKEKLEQTLRVMRANHPDLPTEHIYFLAALNLAAEAVVFTRGLNGILNNGHEPELD